MPRNPFQFLLPIAPDAFVGRWPLVKSIAADLVVDGGDSHAVIAGRRCGKSSLLNAVKHRLRQTATAEVADWRIVPVSFDMKSGSFDTSEAFFALILDDVCRRVDVASPQRPPEAWPEPVHLDAGWFEALRAAQVLSYRDFEKALGYVLDRLDSPAKPVRLILLLDEIDEVLDQPWTNALFNQLRALIYSGELKERIGLIVAGSMRFRDQLSDRGSPLWNVLKLNFLEAFDDDGMDQLLSFADITPNDVASAIRGQCGGNPFLAQYVLHHLWLSGLANADAVAVDNLVSRFLHEQIDDIEGWARALGKDGLRCYEVLASTDDWMAELHIVTEIADPTVHYKRGLTSLCYHGLAVHDSGWEHYRRAGNLFKAWFDDHGIAFLGSLEPPPTPVVTPGQTPAVYVAKAYLAAVTEGDSVSIKGGVTGTSVAIGQSATATVDQRHGLGTEDVATLFAEIYKAIDQRDADPDVDKDEIEGLVQKTKAEAAKGEGANEVKIRRWLDMLLRVAPDIFDVAVQAWSDPLSAVGTVLKKIAEAVKKS